jgi:hypothetical protein
METQSDRKISYDFGEVKGLVCYRTLISDPNLLEKS